MDRLEIRPIRLPRVDLNFDAIVRRLTKVLGPDYLILGGAVRDMYCLGKFTTDLDVFVPHVGDPAAYRTKLEADGFKYKGLVGKGRSDPYMDTPIVAVYGFETDTSLAARGNRRYEKGVPVQVVVATDPILAMHTFDWTICQFGYKPGMGFFATRQALESWEAKQLLLYKCHAFAQTSSRLVKLAKRLGLGLDPASVSALHEVATKQAEFEELKNKAVSRPKVPGKKNERLALVSLKKEPDINIYKNPDAVLKFTSPRFVNPHAVLHQLNHHMGFPLGELSKRVVKAALPNLRWIIEYIEGRMLKPTTDFEVDLLTRRQLNGEAEAVTDFDIFKSRAAQVLDEFRVFRADTDLTLLSFRSTRELARILPEHDRFLARLAGIQEGFEQLQHLSVEDFTENRLTVISGAGTEKARAAEVRLAKHVRKLADQVAKLPEKVLVGEFKTKEGETRETSVAIATGARDGIAAMAGELVKVVERRGAEPTWPDVEGVEFVVSNDIADLLTISTGGPWGERNWSSCQSLDSDLGYNLRLAANTRNTLVAYLARGTTWLCRVLVRVDPVGRAIYTEPLYGDHRYLRTIEACIDGHMGRYCKREGVYSGFDFLPYSDTGMVVWGPLWVPAIEADAKRRGSKRVAVALQGPTDDWNDPCAGPEKDPDEDTFDYLRELEDVPDIAF